MYCLFAQSHLLHNSRVISYDSEVYMLNLYALKEACQSISAILNYRVQTLILVTLNNVILYVLAL